jgi:hypothetical protein
VCAYMSRESHLRGGRVSAICQTQCQIHTSVFLHESTIQFAHMQHLHGHAFGELWGQTKVKNK